MFVCNMITMTPNTSIQELMMMSLSVNAIRVDLVFFNIYTIIE